MIQRNYVELPQAEIEAFRKAESAMGKAYAPYSKLKVGACIIDPQGRTYTGCNIENASFGATLCAERTAISRLVLEGGKAHEVYLCSTLKRVIWPCGICLQVLKEFESNTRVHSLFEDQVFTATLEALLPFAFEGLLENTSNRSKN